MPLDPTLVSLIVKEAGSHLGRLLQQAFNQSDKKSDDVIEKAYSKLRPEITDNSLRVLLLLEGGRQLHPIQARRELAALISRQEASPPTQLEDNVEYRLKFLRLLGLVSGGTELYITHLGKSFLDKARDNRDFPNVLFEVPSSPSK